MNAGGKDVPQQVTKASTQPTDGDLAKESPPPAETGDGGQTDAEQAGQ